MAIPLLILLTEGFGVRFAVWIEQFFAAFLPRRFQFGHCDVPVRPEAAGFYNALGASRGTRGRRDRAYLAGRAPLRLATFALPTHREVVAAALRISALG